MSLAKTTTKSINNYSDKIKAIKELIKESDALIIGIGSGLSAAGGLNYFSEELVKKWFPEHYALGRHSIVAIQRDYWVLHPNEAEKFWSFWARHIWHIRYETELTEPYKILYEIVKDKNYFICTTNADSQTQKAGFNAEKIFAPQGDYCYCQCIEPCRDEIFYNEAMIKKMVENMPSPFEVRSEDVPFCPHCGKNLMPNLRCDGRFVETPHLKNSAVYANFIESNKNKKIVFLELGVGYNTPGIIKYPFEACTETFKHAHLVRVNLTDTEEPQGDEDKIITLHKDLLTVLKDLKTGE